MSADLDMSQYLDLFLQEGEEQLEILEQELLKLESDPSVERMNSIFRAAHTLKGSSRAMGFVNFAGVTHEMENLLDSLRAHKLELSTEICNALLQCLDTLRNIKDSIESGEGDVIDASNLIAELQALLSDAGPARSAEEAAAEVEEQFQLPEGIAETLALAAAEKPVWHATFVLRNDCVMKFVRAFMAVNIIGEGGELLAAVPDVAALEEEQFDSRFDLYFQHTGSEAHLKTSFAGIGEVESITLEAMKFDEEKPSSGKSKKASKAKASSEQEPAPAPEVASAPSADATPVTPQPAANATPTVATPAANTTPAATPAKKTEANQTVRVDVARLDELMNLVGELVIDRTRITQIGTALAAKYELDENIEALAETVGHINRITSELQDQLMKARMLPIDTVFNRFPRMVRDLAQKLGKDIKLDLIGGDTELDRSVIEVIGDPLLHILRNSIDHGVEKPEHRLAKGKPAQGTVTVSARHLENHIVIEIEDDGNGIDHERVKAKAISSGFITKEQAERMTEKEALNLIFASGLSTAAEVSEVSGRGVGMDIVRSNIQKLGGLIDLESNYGSGSKFMLRLPLTLAIIRGLLVKVSGVVYVLPLGSVVETLLIQSSDIQRVNKNEVFVMRGMTTPLVRLRKIFSTREFTPPPTDDSHFVVIVGLADQRMGFIVDSLVGEQEVVIKSLNRFCGDVKGISGATILGNGKVALIVDVNGILALATQ